MHPAGVRGLLRGADLLCCAVLCWVPVPVPVPAPAPCPVGDAGRGTRDSRCGLWMVGRQPFCEASAAGSTPSAQAYDVCVPGRVTESEA